ncbi:MAG: hypothetical protein A2Z97_04675 [Bdellovibrionales bacterium GWB1_52_6]|nr:MAG: hypothetical protein A2Z97_04675 [Bdellovibrionales bacterium GWB1_52_6]
MLIYSDNTASDLLIRHIGLNAVNNFVQEFAPDGFSGITRLADVRRDMYSFFHPRAAQLGNPDFLDLWNIRPERARLRHLAKLLRLKSSELKIRHLDEAFTLYYAQKLNTAKLSTYGVLLEKLVESKLFARESTTRLLLEILARTATGRQRLRAGFPGHYIFAHKTGTQFKRACDFGISWSGQDLSPKPRRLVIAACVRDFKTTREAETALKKIGQAIYSSGALPR